MAVQTRNRISICTTISPEDKEYLNEKNIPIADAIRAHCNQLKEYDGMEAGKLIQEMRETITKMGNNLAKVTGILINVVGIEKYKEMVA